MGREGCSVGESCPWHSAAWLVTASYNTHTAPLSQVFRRQKMLCFVNFSLAMYVLLQMISILNVYGLWSIDYGWPKRTSSQSSQSDIWLEGIDYRIHSNWFVRLRALFSPFLCWDFFFNSLGLMFTIFLLGFGAFFPLSVTFTFCVCFQNWHCFINTPTVSCNQEKNMSVLCLLLS